MTLTTRMIAPIALIMSIALAYVADSAYERARKVISASAVTTESSVVESTSRELEGMLEAARSFIRFSTRRDTVVRYAKQCLIHPHGSMDPIEQAVFDEQLKKSSVFHGYVEFIMFIDRNGVSRASSRSYGEGIRYADTDFFRRAMSGMSAMEGPLFTRASRNYTFMLAEPVWVDGEVAGVIAGAVDMESVAKDYIDPITMSGKGFLYVIDPNGQIILHPDRGKMIGNAMVPQCVFSAATDGGSGSYGHEHDDVDYYDTFRTLGNGWVVIATMSRDLLFRDLTAMRNGTILAAILAVLVVVVAMLIIIYRIVDVLRRGVKFAEQVAAGDLSRTLDVDRNDEIGTLVNALNTMVGRLRSSFSLALRRTKEAEAARARATSTSQELQAVINSVEGGVARFVPEGSVRVIWANPGFYALSGTTPEAFAADCGNGALSTVHPDDRAAFLRTVGEAAGKDAFSVEYRLCCRDGGTRWVYLRARRMGEWQGKPLFIGVFVDVSEQKKVTQALEIEQARYQVITEITDEILFELDIPADTITFSSNYEKIFGRPLHEEHYLASGRRLGDLIHPDDARQIDMPLPGDRDFVEFTARLKTAAHGYQWFAVCFKTLRDRTGAPVRIVGRITNVHAKKLEEDRLRRDAQTDTLTGLYNKGTFEQSAIRALSESGPHALIIADIDDFKNVNDTYGHLFGDTVIRTLSGALRETFRASDLAGRVGGDEFAVLARNAADRAAISSRCRRLLDSLAGISFGNGYHMSVSLGVSFSPEHGKDYPTLFAHADAALYHLKKHGGKGGLTVYSGAAPASAAAEDADGAAS